MNNAYAVILAGGRGERFWPLSTSRRPKQVLKLFGGKSLIARAVEHIEGLVPPERVLVVTSAPLADAIRSALPQVPAGNVIGEPCGRDTAAAIALATAVVGRRDPDGVLCVLTADHIIGDADRFRQILRAGCAMASERPCLITIGIQPTHPSTGFGYIETDRPLEAREGVEFWATRRFVEKPDRATAEQYLAGGRHFWNSGMFIASAATFGKALATHRPVLGAMSDRLRAVADTPDFGPQVEREYAAIEKISIDYAVMEKADNIVMIRGTFGWDDVGSWSSIEGHFPGDGQGNVVVGICETLGAANNIVVSQDRLTALIGVRDLVVVQAPGATLVCSRDRVQDVRRMVQQLQAAGRYGELL